MSVKVSFNISRIATAIALVALTFLTLTGVSQAARHVISSLPYTFSANDMTSGQTDTLVLGSRNLHSNTGGIVLQAVYGNPLHDVVVNLGNDTISFGEGGGNSNVGLRLTGTNSYMPYNIKVVGGHIIHNTPSGSADGNRCIDVQGHNILFQDVDCVVKGYNASAFYGSNMYTWNVEVSGGRYHSDVTAFTSRCNYDAPVMKLTNLYSSTIANNNAPYHFNIHDIVIDGGPHMGIAAMGREGGNDFALVKIHNCQITTDARNDFYTSYDGLCHSTSNPYGIALRHVDAGTQVYNNTITSGNTYGGNRGILIEYGNGNASNPIEIYGNYVDVHEGPNVEYGDGLPVHGIRIRYGNRYLHVYDNTFICTGDNNSSTTAYGSQVHTFRYSWNITDSHNIFERNHIVARALSSGVVADAMTLEGDDVPSPPHDPTLIIRDNRIETSSVAVKWGDINGGGPGTRLDGDTISFLSPSYSPETFHLGHLGNNWDCTENSAKDVVYLNGAAYDDINFASGGTADITILKTLRITVRGSNNTVIPGATVTIRNAYNHQVASGLTNSAGVFTAAVSYLYQSRTGTDSTSYNSFTINAQKDADQANQSISVTPTTAGIQLVLSNTAGNTDTTPPGQINDLGAVTGGGEGKINLSWTSSGDDGTSGTATFYSIRYSTSNITTSNFDAIADSMTNPPTPAVSGTPQTTVLANLTPDTRYYVAIKVYDDGMNPSSLSNVVSAISSYSIPAGDTTGTDTTGTGTNPTDTVVTQFVPNDGATVNSDHPVLSARNIGASGSNSYFFEVAENASFSPLVASSPAIPQSYQNYTYWEVDSALTPDQAYYWRVRVNSYPYSDAVQFTVGATSDVVAYPNPVSFLQGESVTFVLPPTGPVDLLIQTSAGETVLHPTNLSGQYVWDGRNASGNPVAVGIYLWYIEGTSYKGKIVNVP
jgi:hypothetical protein